jgi:hypothetical protein
MAEETIKPSTNPFEKLPPEIKEMIFRATEAALYEEVDKSYSRVEHAKPAEILAEREDYDQDLEKAIRVLLPRADLLSIEQQKMLLRAAGARPDLTIEAAKNSAKFEQKTFDGFISLLVDEINENEGGDWTPIAIALAGRDEASKKDILGYMDKQHRTEFNAAEEKYLKGQQEGPEQDPVNASRANLDNLREFLFESRDRQIRTRGGRGD